MVNKVQERSQYTPTKQHKRVETFSDIIFQNKLEGLGNIVGIKSSYKSNNADKKRKENEIRL